MKEAESKKILVVDDEPDILAIIRVLLQNAHFTVITSENGLEAVKKVYGEQPDCIILDVMMPQMNGYQVCRLLKHDHRTKNIPIILCTVKSLEMDRLYGMTTGADYYLTKPFNPGDLLNLVNDAIRQRPVIRSRRASPEVEASSTDAILTDINQLLDQKLREYTILQYVSRTIAGTLNLDDLLRIILRSTTTDLGYKKGFFLLISEDEAMEERISTEERWDRSPWKGDLRNYPGLRTILERGVPKIVENSRMEEGIIPEAVQRYMVSTTTAVVPVIAKGKALGVILVDCGLLPGGFTEDALGFFMTLAGQAGLAIENAQLYAKTLKLSITDGLTGLFNYRYLMERLDGEFTRAKRYNRDMALFILDIDHFKKFNDRFGHLKGDEALRKLGEILRTIVREVDVVARYGGEEFALILPETDAKEALIFAERLRKSVAEAWAEQLTVSVGVGIFGKEMESPEALLHRADEALYDAKKKGRNKVCLRQ